MPSKQVAYRLGLLVIVAAAPMAAGPFLLRIASVLVSAQTGQFIIRPHAYVPGAQFDNPDWAYEDPNTKSSVKTIYRRCGTICTTPDSATTTWLGVPDGYEPTSLEVNWHATASLAGPYGGDAATMTAKIEYSLDNGQGWTVLEQVTWMANSPSCTNHRHYLQRSRGFGAASFDSEHRCDPGPRHPYCADDTLRCLPAQNL